MINLHSSGFRKFRKIVLKFRVTFAARSCRGCCIPASSGSTHRKDAARWAAVGDTSWRSGAGRGGHAAEAGSPRSPMTPWRRGTRGTGPHWRCAAASRRVAQRGASRKRERASRAERRRLRGLVACLAWPGLLAPTRRVNTNSTGQTLPGSQHCTASGSNAIGGAGSCQQDPPGPAEPPEPETRALSTDKAVRQPAAARRARPGSYPESMTLEFPVRLHGKAATRLALDKHSSRQKR